MAWGDLPVYDRNRDEDLELGLKDREKRGYKVKKKGPLFALGSVSTPAKHKYLGEDLIDYALSLELGQRVNKDKMGALETWMISAEISARAIGIRLIDFICSKNGSYSGKTPKSIEEEPDWAIGC